jgi:dTDP-glucose 4,6-dehydratase
MGNFTPRNMLVTGGAGFIGSNFIRHVLDSQPDARITNLDALTYAGSQLGLAPYIDNERYEFAHGSITDGDLVTTILSNKKIDTVVHFAAESHVDRSITGPEAFIDTNIVGTFRLLDAARTVWGDTLASRRFLHVSTDEVYGTLSATDPAFTESTPFAPNSPYAASKASSDMLARSYFHTYGFPVITTNCSNNYGPFQFPEKLIPLMIVNALAGKPLPIYGDGQQVRDWLYVEDHCAAIWRAISAGKLGRTYNVGGNNEMPNMDIVHSICDLLDELQPRDDTKSYREQIEFVDDRPGHDRRYAVNADRIANELGWTPSESFATGIRKTVEWYLANAAWVESIKTKLCQERQNHGNHEQKSLFDTNVDKFNIRKAG